jgi:hypothetical protein
VDPRDWKARNQMTINIGLGTGSKTALLQQIQMLMTYQEKAVQIGLVSKGRFYNSARDMVRLIKPGGDANAYFIDPSAPPDQNDPALQPAPDPKMADIQAKMQIEQAKQQNVGQEFQMKMTLEREQAQDDSATERLKQQGEAQLAAQKLAHDQEMARVHAAFEERKTAQKMQHDAMIHEMKMREMAQTAQHKDVEFQQKMRTEAMKSLPEVATNTSALHDAVKEMSRPRVKTHTFTRHPKTNLVMAVKTEEK